MSCNPRSHPAECAPTLQAWKPGLGEVMLPRSQRQSQDVAQVRAADALLCPSWSSGLGAGGVSCSQFSVFKSPPAGLPCVLGPLSSGPEAEALDVQGALGSVRGYGLCRAGGFVLTEIKEHGPLAKGGSPSTPEVPPLGLARLIRVPCSLNSK